MSDDRALYADIVSNGAGGIMASIEGQTYGPGVPSLDPGLSAGDCVPVGFMHPGSSRQPLLLARRPILKEISQGVLDHFLRRIPTFTGFAHWIQSEGSWGCPSGVTVNSVPPVYDITKAVRYTGMGRYTAGAFIRNIANDNTLSDASDQVGLVAFQDSSGAQLYALMFTVWDGDYADSLYAIGSHPIAETATGSDVVIREHRAFNDSTDYHFTPLLGAERKSGSGFMTTTEGQRGRRGGYFFLDQVTDPNGVYVCCLQTGFYFLRRSDQAKFKVAKPADVSRDYPSDWDDGFSIPGDGYIYKPFSLRTGSYSVYGKWILEGNYDAYDNESSAVSNWALFGNPGGLTFDRRVLVAPNHANRASVWLSERELDYTMTHQILHLSHLIPNLLRSMGCGFQASFFNSLPATRWPVLIDLLTDPGNPRTEAVLWFSGIDTDLASRLAIAKIHLATGEITKVDEFLASPTYFPLYASMVSDLMAWWASEINSTRVSWRSSIDDDWAVLDSNAAGNTSASGPLNDDADADVRENAGTGFKKSNSTVPYVRKYSSHGNSIYGQARSLEVWRGNDFGTYKSGNLVKTLDNSSFCLCHPLPGDLDEDSLPSGVYPGVESPGSDLSPSGVVGKNQNHYLIHSEPDQIIINVIPGGAERSVPIPYATIGGTYPEIPVGALNVVTVPFGINSVATTWIPVRAYSGGAGAVMYTLGKINMVPITKTVYRTYLVKRNLDLSRNWKIVITDYFNWQGVAGTTMPWVSLPADAYPQLNSCWQWEEVGDYVFVLRQHVWHNMSLSSNRNLASSSQLLDRDPYLDVYRSTDGTLLAHVNLRIPSDVPARAYNLWVKPTFIDGYSPRFRCGVNARGDSWAKCFLAWRPASGDAGFGTSSDTYTNTAITFGLTNVAGASPEILSRYDQLVAGDWGNGDFYKQPLLSAFENLVVSPSGSSFWLGGYPNIGDGIYQQPAPAI